MAAPQQKPTTAQELSGETLSGDNDAPAAGEAGSGEAGPVTDSGGAEEEAEAEAEAEAAAEAEAEAEVEEEAAAEAEAEAEAGRAGC